MYDKRWNWQQDDWPHFHYDGQRLEALEKQFLVNAGFSFGIAKHVSAQEKQDIIVNLISNEAYKTSEIEGELLNRDSLQSSIKRHFGYRQPASHNHPKEEGIAEMMLHLYHHFDIPLTHHILYLWHQMLMNGRRDLKAIGRYRHHKEAMQVVSGCLYQPNVHFEAPPSLRVAVEMEGFITWFNQTAPGGSRPLPALTRAAIAHLYFVSIHPFEDGNGRIARALVEKVLAQHLEQPTLIALSEVIQAQRKDYYDQLERQNKHTAIDGWLIYFAKTVLKAQAYTVKEMEFLIQKTRFFDRFSQGFNQRQQKVVTRLFAAGINGFTGGLSAKNYISITRAAPSTATRDLQALVAMGALTKTGERKSTRYHLNLEAVKSKTQSSTKQPKTLSSYLSYSAYKNPPTIKTR